MSELDDFIRTFKRRLDDRDLQLVRNDADPVASAQRRESGFSSQLRPKLIHEDKKPKPPSLPPVECTCDDYTKVRLTISSVPEATDICEDGNSTFLSYSVDGPSLDGVYVFDSMVGSFYDQPFGPSYCYSYYDDENCAELQSTECEAFPGFPCRFLFDFNCDSVFFSIHGGCGLYSNYPANWLSGGNYTIELGCGEEGSETWTLFQSGSL